MYWMGKQLLDAASQSFFSIITINPVNYATTISIAFIH